MFFGAAFAAGLGRLGDAIEKLIAGQRSASRLPEPEGLSPIGYCEVAGRLCRETSLDAHASLRSKANGHPATAWLCCGAISFSRREPEVCL